MLEHLGTNFWDTWFFLTLIINVTGGGIKLGIFSQHLMLEEFLFK